jgi:DNA helicase-2/ATP-dependent DNA helicase PcrA
MSKYLDWLAEVKKDDGQLEALNRLNHCVVIAGPGAGKTRILVLKAAKLLYENVFQPQGIACVTYAHAMAEELRRQVESLGVSSEAYNVFIGTLHSFCFSNILIPFGKIYGIPVPEPLRFASDRQQAEIYADIWGRLDIRKQNILPRPEREKITGILLPRLPTDFQKYRRTHLNEQDVDGRDEFLDEIVDMYERALLDLKTVDFDLATKWSVRLLEEQEFVRKSLESKYPWLLVDEYQDLGLALHRIVKVLTVQTSVKLFAIGDPNQCIYDFTGANPNYFLELENNVERYGRPIRLNKNYRSCSEIIRQAEKIPPIPINQDCHRVSENGIFRIFESDRQLEKTVDTIKKLEERRGILPREILILGRSNAACKNIVNAIKAKYPELPISKSAGQIYDSKKPLLEWIENLAQYSVGINNIRFNDLLNFWAKIHSVGNLSGNDALSFENRLKLFSALDEAKQYSNSALKWLDNIFSAIKLEEKLISYSLEQPDDVDELRKLRLAFEVSGEWHSFSLHSYASIVTKENQLSVETLHSSKGQQRKAVIIAMAEKLNATDREAQVSNRRLMYVGMTRAEDILIVLHDGTSYIARNILN